MKRILFVDDEVNVLHGLRRMLHGRRHEWQTAFVTSGADALALMDSQQFDVVVTDMRMPGMNGAQLLAEVQHRHPAAVRFVLSGQSDMETAMRSVSVSHQFLSKPCDPELLRAAVDRCCRLQDMLQSPQLRDVLGSVSELPPLPDVYRQLTAALGREDVGLAEVADIVEQDIAIATKLLQLVNSSYFGLRRVVSDVRQAASFLGVNTIRDLVLSCGAFRQFAGRELPAGLSIAEEQDHAMQTARLARTLVTVTAEQEYAFLAGMMHGIGKLVCATHMPASMQRVLDSGGGSTRPFHVAEREVLGVGHAEIGAYVLGLWGLPYPVIEAVAHQNHPSRSGSTTFGVLGAVHVACALVAEAAGRPRTAIALDEGYLAVVGVAPRLDEWRQRLREQADPDRHTDERRPGAASRR